MQHESSPAQHRRRTDNPRPPTILDGVVFIAAMAIAFAIARGKPYGYSPFEVEGPDSATRRVLHTLQTGILWMRPFAITLTATLVILRLIPPRPRLRRIARQPGFIACVAALIVMAARISEAVLHYTLCYLTRPSSAIRLPAPPFVRRDYPAGLRPFAEILYNTLVNDFPDSHPWMTAAAIIVAWFVLWANGKKSSRCSRAAGALSHGGGC